MINIIDGTIESETIDDTSDADIINAFAGNDIINVRDGSDTVYAGEGNDTINVNQTASVNAAIYGESGNDTIIFGSITRDADDLINDYGYFAFGNDIYNGGEGNDRIYDIFGGDTIYGESGSDTIDTIALAELGLENSAGIDEVIEAMRDINQQTFIYAGEGNDLVRGHSWIYAGAGNDTIFTAFSSSVVMGEDGNDVVYAGIYNDSVIGGEGNDRIFGDKAPANSSFVDTIEATGNDYLAGARGSDLIQGMFGNDTIDGGMDSDMLTGDSGNDEILAGFGNDVAIGGADNDTIYGGQGNDRIYGDELRDSSFLAYPFETDQFTDVSGIDYIYGEQGNDLIFFDANDAVVDGGADFDILRGAGNIDLRSGAATSNFEGVQGMASNDSFYIHAVESESIFALSPTVGGGADHRAFFGGAGTDILYIEFDGILVSFNSNNTAINNLSAVDKSGIIASAAGAPKSFEVTVNDGVENHTFYLHTGSIERIRFFEGESPSVFIADYSI